MFERFTARARRVLPAAYEEARLLNHNYIGTEHLLLGLLNVSDGLAAQALNSSGVHLEDMRHGIETMIGRGATMPTGDIPFTPRAKRCLELSLRESFKLGHNYIGTEHVLLGILREGEGVAVKLLLQHITEVDTLRQHIVALVSSFTVRAAGAEEAPFQRPRLSSRRAGGRREGKGSPGRWLRRGVPTAGVTWDLPAPSG